MHVEGYWFVSTVCQWHYIEVVVLPCCNYSMFMHST